VDSSPDRRSLPGIPLLLAVLLCALPAWGADLRPEKSASAIAKVFPAKAKLRLLNVWATWCVPCVAEMPDLRAIDETFGPELALAGVSMDDMIPDASPEKVNTFLDEQKIAFPNVYYTGNADELGNRLDFDGGIPVTIVYDDRGVEVWRHQGRLKLDETIARLRELLRRKR
jgi:thiol-disulfide isomerase/thioredoxin